MEIRTLKAEEIECRIGTAKDTSKGMSLLLYKDARADMRILDETFTPFGWERKHELIDGNLYCTVSVYDKEKDRWISKQDVGTESNTEKEKGQASDSFKRACFNWGIGRELYSAPFIWINGSKGYNKYEKFEVKEIDYNENKEIIKLLIVDSKGNEAFRLGKINSKPIQTNNNTNVKVNMQPISEPVLISEAQRKRMYAISNGKDQNKIKEIITKYGFTSSKDVTRDKYKNICDEIEKL